MDNRVKKTTEKVEDILKVSNTAQSLVNLLEHSIKLSDNKMVW